MTEVSARAGGRGEEYRRAREERRQLARGGRSERRLLETDSPAQDVVVDSPDLEVPSLNFSTVLLKNLWKRAASEV